MLQKGIEITGTRKGGSIFPVELAITRIQLGKDGTTTTIEVPDDAVVEVIDPEKKSDEPTKPATAGLTGPTWQQWPADGKALVGDDLSDFVNGKLFPYLRGFTQKASGPNRSRVRKAVSRPEVYLPREQHSYACLRPARGSST